MHKNTVTGKSYIGLTSFTMEERWKQHVQSAMQKKTPTRKFWNAIRKYGIDCWQHIVLSTCVELSEARILEKQFIQKFDSYHLGYNSTLGGEGLDGYKHSVETRQKIGEIGKGKVRSEAFKENVRRHMRAFHKTRKYKDYIVIAPDGSRTNTTNIKKFCSEKDLKLENLRWTLKTGKPCPYVQAGWQVIYG